MRGAAVGSRPPCEGRGPLADQDDELNTLVAAVVFDRKPVVGAPGDWAGAAVPDPVGAVRNLPVYGHNDLMAYGAYLGEGCGTPLSGAGNGPAIAVQVAK